MQHTMYSPPRKKSNLTGSSYARHKLCHMFALTITQRGRSFMEENAVQEPNGKSRTQERVPPANGKNVGKPWRI